MLMGNFSAIGVIRNAVVSSTQLKRTIKAAFMIYPPRFVLRIHCTPPNFGDIRFRFSPWKDIARYRPNKVVSKVSRPTYFWPSLFCCTKW